MSLAGWQLGRYQLVRQIGSGGMGEVYLATDTRINRQVAIKVMRSEGPLSADTASTQESARLFYREARAVAALDHSRILPLFDYGEETMNGTDLTYMVMPFREEGTFSDWLRRRGPSQALALEDVAYFLDQAASALQYAHNHQIIHQDVKPSNFLVRANQENPNHPDLLLADFGIAKFTSATSQMTNSSRGTPAYMAPEQWQGHPGPATDQYALAVMVYELLAGRLPFQGNMGQVMFAHMQKQPQSLRTYNPRVPAAVDAVVLRALAKDPAGRFPSIADFARAFRQALSVDLPAPSEHHFPDLRTMPMNTSIVGSEGRPSVTTSQYAGPVPMNAPSFEGKRRGVSAKNLIMVAGLIIVLVGAIGGGVFYFASGKLLLKEQAGIPAKSTTPIARASATVPIVATTSSAHPSPTATTVKNTVPDPYAAAANNEVLDDPLQDNSKGYQWGEDSDANGNCKFIGGAYHITMTLPGIEYCYARGLAVGDFVYQVQMTIVRGNSGGMIFRSAQGDQNFYYCSIGQDGSYNIEIYTDQSTSAANILRSGSSAAIHKGTGQSNVLSIVARGHTLDFYVNMQRVDSVMDNTYTSGYVGLASYSNINGSALETESAFSNAKVWKF